MRRGVVNAMRSGELERLVGEMTEVLETQAMGKALVLSCLPMSRKAESIRTRVRKGGPEQPQSCGCRIRGSFDGRTAGGRIAEASWRICARTFFLTPLCLSVCVCVCGLCSAQSPLDSRSWTSWPTRFLQCEPLMRGRSGMRSAARCNQTC